MAGLTKIQVAQKACGLVGIDEITSFSDDSAEASTLDSVYETLVEDTLGLHPWRFATTQKALDLNAAEPLARWDAAYDIPTDCLAIQAVTVGDVPVDFDRYASYIYCDQSSNDTVVLDYTFRESELRWPGYFTFGVQLRLASILAIAVQERGNVGDMLEKRAMMHLEKAAMRDSVGRTTRKLPLTRITKGRLGRRG